MSDKKDPSKIFWTAVPIFLGIALAVLIIVSEEYEYLLLGNILYGLIGLFMFVFGVWKTYVMVKILLEGKQAYHHGEPVEKGSVHYKLLILHGAIISLIFPIAGAYLMYLALNGIAI